MLVSRVLSPHFHHIQPWQSIFLLVYVCTKHQDTSAHLACQQHFKKGINITVSPSPPTNVLRGGLEKLQNWASDFSSSVNDGGNLPASQFSRMALNLCFPPLCHVADSRFTGEPR